MKKEEIILRKSADGSFVFYSPDRSFKSDKFETREKRDEAIDNYISNIIKLEKERQLRLKEEKELFKYE